MTEFRDPALPGEPTPEPATEPVPGSASLADEPIPDEWGAGTSEGPSSQHAKGREWLGQLEAMIQDVATQAAPIARQVAAKAAELAAVAGEKAGPFAQKAAEATTEAGQRLAVKAHQVAADLRAQQAAEGEAAAEAGAAPVEPAAADEAAEAPRDTPPA